MFGADGNLDLDATLRKNADAYVALEKRLGSSDVPPPSAGEYKITAPEALKDAFQPEDSGFKEFLTKAHAAGMTQKQMDATMEAFFSVAPKLVMGARQLDADGCVAALQKVWDTPEGLTTGFRAADRALAAFGGERADALRTKYGNDPDILWFAAQIGAQLAEDRAPSRPTTSEADIRSLEASVAYSDEKHPEHQVVSMKVKQHYEQLAKAMPGMIN